MRRLFVRVVLASLAALIALQLGVALFAMSSTDRRFAAAQHEVLDDKLAWAVQRLEGVPESHLEPELHLLRRTLAVGLRVVPLEAPRVEGEVSVPFRSGTRLVALPGVAPHPPPRVIVLQILLGVLGFSVVLWFLGRPLFVDLGRLERATRRIAAGDLEARSGLQEGPVAQLGGQFDAMADRVQAMVEGQRELLGAVSHELRTPMARMRFQVEALRGEVAEAPLDRLDRELDAMDTLLGELLTMSSLEQPPDEPPEPEATEAVVHAVVARMEPLSDVVLTVRGHAGLPIGGRDLGRIVENLVSNAQRHARSRVEVVLAPGELCVDDDGPGVAPGVREKVLEPFYTGEKSRNRALGGVGLGLTLVVRSAVRWGARVEVTDAPLGGARFRVTWG